jgi:branched-chain amino acid transport system ATP-binding protein
MADVKKVILEVKNLKKYFGEVKAVDNVNLSVNEGSILSIVGPNGAGKSTLINLITGLLKPDSGKILFEGRDITFLQSHKRALLGIARCFQVPSLFMNFTVFDNIRVSLLPRLGLAGKALSLIDKNVKVNEKSIEIINSFLLAEVKDSIVKDLGEGYRKLLDCAVAFAMNPKLLLLDEPTAGIITSDKMKILEIIKENVKRKKVTTVIVEHDMDIVAAISDTVAVMNEGKIIAEGKPDEVIENPLVKRIFTGES